MRYESTVVDESVGVGESACGTEAELHSELLAVDEAVRSGDAAVYEELKGR